MQASSDSHPRFTDTTWADLRPYGLTRASAQALRGWEGLHDLAVEAHETTRDYCSLTFEDWRELVHACASNLPVFITRRCGPDMQETITHIAMIDSILTLRSRNASNLTYRSWGFSSSLSLGDLLAVTVPATTYGKLA